MGIEMKREVSNAVAQRPSARRLLRDHLFALTLTVAPLAMMAHAQAACTPTSPVNNTIVTCTGATTNQNGTNGYGTSTDVGNTINVATGATVTSNLGDGIRFNSATVNNAGTISTTVAGAGVGVLAGNGGAVINNFAGGFISSTGNGGQAINSLGVVTLTNSGGIQQLGNNGVAIQLGDDNNT